MYFVYVQCRKLCNSQSFFLSPPLYGTNWQKFFANVLLMFDFFHWVHWKMFSWRFSCLLFQMRVVNSNLKYLWNLRSIWNLFNKLFKYLVWNFSSLFEFVLLPKLIYKLFMVAITNIRTFYSYFHFIFIYIFIYLAIQFKKLAETIQQVSSKYSTTV